VTERALDLVPGLVRGRKSNGYGKYNRAAKRQLVLRCLQPGVSLAATALAHGINANLLRKWVVGYAREQGLARPPRRTGGARALLLPVSTEVAPAGVTTAMAAPAASGYLEICVGAATIRVIGRMDPAQLRSVLECLAART
jgi:transposase-like protein